ncbi:MAG: response regulator transcription factor [Bacillota bacterium]
MIVDDMVILRESLKYVIEQDSNIKVVGTCGNGKEALEACEKLNPDLVLMDLMMPVCDGAEGTRLIKSKFKNIKIIILTTFKDEENVSKALRNGADGYVLKDVDKEDLILTIKSVSKGLGIIHRDVFETVTGKLDSHKSSAEEEVDAANETPLPKDVSLTEMEKNLIRLIIDGKNYSEMAQILFLSEGRIRNTVSALLQKLDLRDKVQLAVYALRNKLV